MLYGDNLLAAVKNVSYWYLPVYISFQAENWHGCADAVPC